MNGVTEDGPGTSFETPEPTSNTGKWSSTVVSSSKVRQEPGSCRWYGTLYRKLRVFHG